MESQIRPDELRKFLRTIIEIERRYAYELKNVRTDRRGEIMEAVNVFAAEELEKNEAEEN